MGLPAMLRRLPLVAIATSEFSNMITASNKGPIRLLIGYHEVLQGDGLGKNPEM